MAMTIKPFEISVKDIHDGYVNSDEEGVTALKGKLNIRPKYQREFIYSDDKRNAVINTIIKGYPLNVMYWVKNEDGTYEVLDGQQRTISFCEFLDGNFSIDYKGYPTKFKGLPPEMIKAVEDYKCQIYICEGGTTDEKLDWFNIINIAGEVLRPQELRNAFYTGEWLTSAKKYFSKTNCKAYKIGSEYMSGSCIRQDYLETVLEWISSGKIKDYMNDHRDDSDANELWLYYNSVIEWVKTTFSVYYKEMKGVDWGQLYNKYHTKKYDNKKMNKEISALMEDEDVTKKSGIFPYLLGEPEKVLSIRTFSDKQKREAYTRQKGICPHCKKHFAIDEMEGDHIKPWSKGGHTTSDNCQMLCMNCNRLKGGK